MTGLELHVAAAATTDARQLVFEDIVAEFRQLRELLGPSFVLGIGVQDGMVCLAAGQVKVVVANSLDPDAMERNVRAGLLTLRRLLEGAEFKVA